MKFIDLINGFVAKTKSNIIDLAQTELSNENKKLVLDNKITIYLDTALNKLKINFILKSAVKKLILPNVSLITQIIFDLLKARIEGITN